VGFKGGKWNPTSGNLTVRNSDAHAWCEILDRVNQRWLRVDPTPTVEALGERSPGLAGLERISDRTVSAKFDSLRVLWYRRIVDFNRGAQLELAQRARQAVEGFGRGLKEWLAREIAMLRLWVSQPWNVQRFATITMEAGLLFAAGWAARLGWITWRRRRGGDPVRREAGRWLVRLGARGESPEGRDLEAELRRLRYGAAKTWPNPEKIFRASRRFWRRRTN